MPIKVTMPALSPTMEEGNLAKWMVKEGDSVAPGDVIAEIETDKATMEVEAVDEGTVAKIVVPEGTEGVKVNALIAILAEEGEDAGEAAKAAEGGSDSKPEPKVESKAEKPAKEEAPAAKSEAKPAEAKAAPSADGERVFASPLARRLAKEAGLDLSAIAGSGPKGR
ncbi:biotin/lipoyl-containing protein, partial [Nitratireductor rhodophyticola]|uniref:biotin/lipoyl-containing protein n=1 Tax=Nitratireductor rhodophyticola TaxID=2854036 RepID=UPI00300ACE6C